MGQLAQQNARSSDIKSSGQALVTDHTAANGKATAVANQIGVTPPTAPNAKQKAMSDKMSKLSGAHSQGQGNGGRPQEGYQGAPEGSQDEERPGLRLLQGSVQES